MYKEFPVISAADFMKKNFCFIPFYKICFIQLIEQQKSLETKQSAYLTR